MTSILRTVHLWTGLVFGAILVLQGLTGAALGWFHELDAALNPGLLQGASPAGLRAGEPLRLRPAEVQAVHDLLTRSQGYGKPSMLMLPERAGDVVVAWYRPAKPVSNWTQGVTRQVMVDPATLAVLGERNYGEAGLSAPLLMPTLFHLHRYLLAGEAGKIVIAVQGVALALMTLTGIVIWWPRMTRAAIVSALTVRFGGSWPRLSFQLHRSAGALCAPPLLFMALSGVHFNMPAWTGPIVGAVATLTPNARPVNRSAADLAPLPLADVIAAAQAAYPEARVGRVNLPAGPTQPWEIRVRQPGELRQGPGATRISVDARDGSILRVADPLRGPGGDRIVAAFFPLHSGEAFGAAGKVFITLLGLTPLAFFVTGIVVWLKFRRKPKKKQGAGAAKAVKRDAMPA